MDFQVSFSGLAPVTTFLGSKRNKLFHFGQKEEAEATNLAIKSVDFLEKMLLFVSTSLGSKQNDNSIEQSTRTKHT